MTLFLCMAEKNPLSSALVAPAHLPPFKFALLYNPCPFYISTKPQPLPWRRRRTAAAHGGGARRRRGGEVGQLKQQISEHGNVAHQMKPIHAGILV